MISPLTKKEWLQLNQDDHAGYTVCNNKGDRWVLTSEQLSRACLYTEDRNIFRNQFGEMLEKLDELLNRFESKIHRAYLSLLITGIECVVIQKTQEIDGELDDALIEFDIKIAQDPDFSLIRLEVMCLPYASEDAITAFISGEKGTFKRIF